MKLSQAAGFFKNPKNIAFRISDIEYSLKDVYRALKEKPGDKELLARKRAMEGRLVELKEQLAMENQGKPVRTATIEHRKHGDAVVTCGNKKAIVSCDLNENATVWKVWYGDDVAIESTHADKDAAIQAAEKWVLKED